MRSLKGFAGKNAGDILFLTDSKGWTLARIELSADIDSAEISVKLEEKKGLDGIDRVWTFDVDGDPVEGRLSLYYRNTPRANWYPELEAVGRQWELAIAEEKGSGKYEFFDSTINPYSNRVEAEIKLASAHRLVLIHR